MRLSEFEQNCSSVSQCVVCVFSAHHRAFFFPPYEHFSIGAVKSLLLFFFGQSHIKVNIRTLL